MSQKSMSMIALIALAIVAIVLFKGIKSFLIGGNIEAKRQSNKLMQLRIFVQFCAIIILMILAWVYGK
jgi:hypothetical protein